MGKTVKLTKESHQEVLQLFGDGWECLRYDHLSGGNSLV